MNLQELIKARQDALDKANALLEEHADGLDDEQTKTFDALMADADKLADRISQHQRMASARQADSQPTSRPAVAPMAYATPPAPQQAPGIIQSRKRPVVHGKLKVFRGANNPHTPEGRAELDVAYHAGLWLRGTIFSAINPQRSANDLAQANEFFAIDAPYNTTDDAGIVPLELVSYIATLRDTFGVYRQYSRVQPMGSLQTTFNAKNSAMDAEFIDEMATQEEKKNDYLPVPLVAKKLRVYSSVSEELDQDAIVNMADQVLSDIAWAITRREDLVAFRGTGVADAANGAINGSAALFEGNTTWLGSVAAGAGEPTFATLKLDSFLALMGTLPEAAYTMGSPRWYVSGFGFATAMQRLAAAAGGSSMTDIADGMGRRFLGYPVTITEAMIPATPAGANGQCAAVFGDLSLASAVGSRMEIGLASSLAAGFATDEIKIKGYERVDIKHFCPNAGAVDELGSTTVAAGIVGLLFTT